MARYTGPKCKLCRREGMKLFLKGERCFSAKCAFEKRDYPPGESGRQAQFRRRESDYGEQLREKQRIRRVYGVLERQFRRYYEQAEQLRGQTAQNLLMILERRFDNVVYRLGFADSRDQARQLVVHGHFMLNGRRHTVPSALVKIGDVISVREESRSNGYFSGISEVLEHATVLDWLSLDVANLSGTVEALPSGEALEIALDPQLVVEYYSR